MPNGGSVSLELADFPVKDIKFSGVTCYQDQVLQIKKEEMVQIILEDDKITSADIDVAFPGDHTRIINTCDVVDPRVKVSGNGCVFPGIMGPIELVGEGRTNRLAGVTVIPCADYKPSIAGGPTAHKGGILDMWGPGSKATPFGATNNIVLDFKLKDGLTEIEAHHVIQSAELRVARRLAETTRDKTPASVQVFDLGKTDPSLPNVVYILGCVTQWHTPHSGVAYYGVSIRESLPTFIHPNELFDGAITTDARRGSGSWPVTWLYMNNPVVLGLYKEHGKRLNFAGIILQRTRFETESGKLASATCTAQMARTLRADSAIITRNTPSGNNFMDFMLTAQACEKVGVKASLLTPEWGGKDGTEIPLVFYVPEALSIVSTGSTDRGLRLPAPDKVIGGGDRQTITIQPGSPPVNPWMELTVQEHEIPGGIDYFGALNFTCSQY